MNDLDDMVWLAATIVRNVCAVLFVGLVIVGIAQ